MTEGVLRTRIVGVEHREVLTQGECRLAVGHPVVIGRALGWGGRELPDDGLSRVGLTVELTRDGWSIEVGNRNGVVAHPWAQPSFWLDPPSTLRSAWPRVGVRLVGTRRDVEYWVLVEGSWSLPRPAPEPPGVTLSTRRPAGVKPLTGQQRDAVMTLFHQHLQWPPVASPLPRPVAAAASRLGVAPVSLQERLERVQQRAYALGLHRLVGVSDPAYVHFLVRRGVLRIDDEPPESA